MRVGILDIGGMGSRMRAFLGNLMGEQREANPAKAAARSFNPPKPSWSAKMWRRKDGMPIRGPVSVPGPENAWVSRQTARARLRAMSFEFISQKETWDRRHRRRWARAYAGLEYNRMMRDKTNAVENEKELLANAN